MNSFPQSHSRWRQQCLGWVTLSWFHFRVGSRTALLFSPWAVICVLAGSLWTSLQNWVAIVAIVRTIESDSPAEALATAAALADLAFGLSLGTLLVGLGAVIWAFLAYFGYRATDLLVGLIYTLFYPIDLHFMRVEQHHERLLRKIMGWQMVVALAFLLVITGVVLVTYHWEDMVQDRLAPIVTIYGVVLIVTVPIAYGLVWANALALSRRRPHARYLTIYLFSSAARRRHFLSFMTVLVFFALLVWLLFPVLFAWSEIVSVWIAEILRTVLEYDRHFAAASPTAQSQVLAVPDSLSLRINPLSGMLLSGRVAAVRDTLLLWLFIVSLTAGVLGIAIPATVAAVRSVGYRRALWDVAIKTAKSTFISGVLGLLVEYGYRLDTRRGLVWLAIFGFVLSFLFAHDDVLASQMERQTVPGNPVGKEVEEEKSEGEK